MSEFGEMPACRTCHERPARVCDECARATALEQWLGIARHDQGATCVLCERGEAVYCPEHFLDRAITHRRALEDAKQPKGTR